MSGWNDVVRRLLWLPQQASSISVEVDYLHYFVIGVTMAASRLVGLAPLLVFLRYRRRRRVERTEEVHSNWKFEAAIIAGPLSLFLLWWVIGFRTFIRMETPPKDAMDVYVQAKQWMWKFSYPGGPNAIEVLHVPAQRPVRLLMTSRDVIHSFYVPAFRLKKDVLPGRYTQFWFTAVTPGKYQILCAEMCGIGHSSMWGEVVVHDPAEFDEWLAEQRRAQPEKQDAGKTSDSPLISDLARQGERLAAEAGCLKCHTLDGTPHIGPTFLDLYMRTETMQSGQTLIADEGYITQSIMDPQAQIVAGFQPVMPTFQGRLTAPEIGSIVEYIKTLHSTGPGAATSEKPVYDPR